MRSVHVLSILFVGTLAFERTAVGLDPPRNLRLNEPTEAAAHPFPFSFSDPEFFSNMSLAEPIDLACGVEYKNLTVTKHREPAALVNMCESGVTTISQIRLGGDGGVNGDIREGIGAVAAGP